jgi:hypothetical protein
MFNLAAKPDRNTLKAKSLNSNEKMAGKVKFYSLEKIPNHNYSYT